MEEQQREILNQDLQPLSGTFDLPSKSEFEHRGVCLGEWRPASCPGILQAGVTYG
jgi:hypothetical protein